MSRFGMGANPPPGHEWTIGRTAASMVFVREVERRLKAEDLDADMRDRLTKAASDVREKRVELRKSLTVEDFLRSGFPT